MAETADALEQMVSGGAAVHPVGIDPMKPWEAALVMGEAKRCPAAGCGRQATTMLVCFVGQSMRPRRRPMCLACARQAMRAAGLDDWS